MLEEEQTVKKVRKDRVTTFNRNTGSNQDQATNSAISAFVHSIIHGALTDRTVPGLNQKQSLFLASTRVEARKLKKGLNRTVDSEPVIAWFVRKMVYTDNENP
jgi:hypothetical protein